MREVAGGAENGRGLNRLGGHRLQFNRRGLIGQNRPLALMEYAQDATKSVAKLFCQRHYLPRHLVQRLAQPLVGCALDEHRDQRLFQITSPMPPMMAQADSAMDHVAASPNNTMPPNAAMTGTLSCTVAACVACSVGSTRYHTA